MKTKKEVISVSQLVGTAILAALVLILQLLAGSIRVGSFSITLTLIPIVIGAILYGPLSGALLGLLFGILVGISVASGADAGGFLLFSLHPIITILICLCKSTLAGHLSGLVAEGLSKRNLPLGVFLAALTAPIVNTGLFLLGLTLFFRETLSQWAAGSQNLTSYILFGLVGVNFLIELGVNIVLAPVIVRIVHAAHQMKNPEEI